MANEIAEVSKEVQALRDVARLPRALMGGTRTMRAAGTDYLPKAQVAKGTLESQAAYDRRLRMTFLYNAYARTTRHVTGRVFRRPLDVDGVPAAASGMASNFDGNGTSIDAWARMTFADTWVGGLGFAFVDRAPRPDGETEADALKRKPFVVYYPIEKTLGWKKSARHDGGIQIDRIRFEESIQEAGFGPKQIRVIEADKFEIHRQPLDKEGKAQDWVRHDEGPMGLGKVPVRPFYGFKLGDLAGVTPTEDQAWKNLEHWQSSSAQNLLLNVVRVPFLHLAGFTGDSSKPIEISAMKALSGPVNSEVKWVEHSGQALEAGERALAEIVQQMNWLGLQVMLPQTPTTATATMVEHGEASSTLDGVAVDFNDNLQGVLDLWAEWLGVSTVGTATLTTRDLLTISGADDLAVLSQMELAGQISKETLWAEAVRRGKLSQAFDATDEEDRLGLAIPSPNTLRGRIDAARQVPPGE